MKAQAASINAEIGQAPRAFTLIEMIGVLAIVAVIAGLLVPIALRHLDRITSDQEIARLQSLGDALKQSIASTRSIPGITNWATVIATQSGLDTGSVTNNVRNQPRIFLVDTNGWLSTNLPYAQNSSGAPAVPVNARIMLVSSLGKSLPIATGTPLASDFDALWNAPPGTVPWTGWNGDPDDIKIERLNLSPLFVKLVLTTYNSATNGQYAVDSSVTNQVPFTNGFAAYFLKGTVLKLFAGQPVSTLDSSQVLDQDDSFVYEGGKWKDEIRGNNNSSVGDIAGIVAAFLAATPNSKAQDTNSNAQQIRVIQTFTTYMSNYNAWAASGFPNNGLKTYLKNTAQPDMMDAVRGLYYNGSKYSNYPTNAIGCP
jgi:prepilin-type N-terminal cleavage/methylation domain-containing protein